MEKGQYPSDKSQGEPKDREEIVLLVEDLRTAPVNHRISTPEILLRAAVLSQAIKDLSRVGVDRDGARLWVNGGVVSEVGFSFCEICDSLGFNPELVRKSVLLGVKNRRGAQ